MSRAIPEPSPVEDLFTGIVLRHGESSALATAPEAGLEIIASGDLIIRYAIRYQGKTHYAIVPGLVVMDYGDLLTGEEAWDFLIKRSNLHPRAEVAGIRNDGADDMVFVKQLDLAQPVEVLVYADRASRTPLARPTALIGTSASDFPQRLSAYLPLYPNVATWQSEAQS
ncbi:MAG: hypothetical protein DIU68_003555 [Chloroflexota bacterium]|nr:MAG: hypothetical protein DIU68_03500 [Chloroflexota bacterium]